MWVAVALPLLPPVTLGQTRAQKRAEDYDKAARATVLHDANVYVAADADAQKISLVTPGHEVVVMERNGPWVKVFANTDVQDDAREEDENKPEFGEDANVTPASGWIRDKGVVGPPTPGGDAILFGSAANFEEEAEQPHAPKGAAGFAHLLYRRVYEYFPDSSLAPEAAWRSADIRWQLDKRDISTLPSAKEQEAYLRPQLYEGELKKVMKMYPGTRFAALAAYDLLDNKLCGDWQGSPKCPDKEAAMYEKYVKEHPESPAAPEALYDDAWRRAALIEIYKTEEQSKKSDQSKSLAISLAQQLISKYPQSDWSSRGQTLLFLVQQGVPTYGNVIQ